MELLPPLNISNVTIGAAFFRIAISIGTVESQTVTVTEQVVLIQPKAIRYLYFSYTAE